MSEEDEVLYLICPAGVVPEDYDRVAPGFSQNLRRMVRAELTHQHELGAADPIGCAITHITTGCVWSAVEELVWFRTYEVDDDNTETERKAS